MKLSHTPQTLQIINEAYHNGAGGETVSRNFFIRKEQDDMLKALAEQSGETKVTVLRAVIDEWREMKLKGCDK